MTGTAELASRGATRQRLSQPTQTYWIFLCRQHRARLQGVCPEKHAQIDLGQVPTKRVSNLRAHWGQVRRKKTSCHRMSGGLAGEAGSELDPEGWSNVAEYRGGHLGKWTVQELGGTGHTGGWAWGEKIWKSRHGCAVDDKHGRLRAGSPRSH